MSVSDYTGFLDSADEIPLGADYSAEACAALSGEPVLLIELWGNRRTRDEVVLRELFLQPGDRFDPELLGRDLSFLRGLGIFAAVGVVPKVVPGGVVLCYYLVERGELRWGLVYPVVDYRDGRIRLGAVYRHRSFLGAREHFGLEYSRGWEDRFRVSLGRPWLGSYPIEQYAAYRLVDKDDEDEFHLEGFSVSFWLSLQRRRPLENRFLMRLDWGERSFLVSPDRYYEQFSSIGLGYSRDTRNSFSRPSAGGRIEVVGTLFDPILGSTVYQRRVSVFLSRYRKLPMNWVGTAVLEGINRWGGLFYKGVSFLGGIDSIRGHAPGSIDGWEGVDGATGPRGRNHLLLHGELRHDLLDQITLDLPLLGIVDIQGEGVLFADAGYLWSRDRFLLPEDLRESVYSLGGGLRVYTPVGDVLRVELGLAEDGSYRIHLGSGMRF